MRKALAILILLVLCQPVVSFSVLTLPEITNAEPGGYNWFGVQGDLHVDNGDSHHKMGPSDRGWHDPAWGSRLMSFESQGIPGVTMTYTRGDVPLPAGQQMIDPAAERPKWPYDSVQIPSVGPEERPALPLDVAAFTTHLVDLTAEARGLSWISSATVAEEVANRLRQIREAAQAGDLGALRPAGQLSLQLTLVSKHVMAHKSLQATLDITPSSRAKPGHLRLPRR